MLLSLLLLAGCEPELAHPEVLAGMRIDQTASREDFIRNRQTADEFGVETLLLEIPLKADTDSLHTPIIPPHVFRFLEAIRHDLDPEARNFSIALLPVNKESIFPRLPLPAGDVWMDSLRGQLRRVAPFIKGAKRVILGPGFEPVLQDIPAWDALLQDSIFGASFFSLSIRMPEALKYAGWRASGEICVAFPAATDEDIQSRNKIWNRQLEILADSLYQSVIISQTNLLGENKAYQLIQILRFWDRKNVLRAITLNSIYPKISLRDSSSYFGISEDEDLIRIITGL